MFRSHFSSDPNIVGGVIAEVVRNVTPMLAMPDDISGLEIALSEIINNIAEHAYCGDMSGPIELEICRQNEALEFCLLDRGVEMPALTPPSGTLPDLDVAMDDLPEGGFGWFLIRTLVRDLRYERAGGENRLVFRLPAREV